MAFWGELGQKITKGSQGALQKTRDMAGVVSLNAEISDSRSRIRDLYAELGELLMQNSFTKTDREELQKMIDADIVQADSGAAKPRNVELENWKEIFSRIISIRSEEEKIAQNEKKIILLRNETKCPNCGTKISRGTLFCPHCGTKIVWPEPVPEAAAAAEAELNAKPDEPAASETGSVSDAEPAAPETEFASDEKPAASETEFASDEKPGAPGIECASAGEESDGSITAAVTGESPEETETGTETVHLTSKM